MTSWLWSPAGGFVGGHLVADLLRRGCRPVRAVDIKPLDEWFQLLPEADNQSCDLRERDACYRIMDGAAWVYNLAADMGGMGTHRNPQGGLHAVGADQKSPHASVTCRQERVRVVPFGP